MAQWARRFSRALTAGPIRATAAAPQAQDVMEGFRTERAAVTRPDTMQDHDAFGVATAYLSDTLDSMNPYWQPDAYWAAAAIDGGFGAQQDHYFPQP